MKALTPAPFTYGTGLPTYLATSSCRSVSNHVDCPVIAYHHASVTGVFRTSPCMSRLVAAPRRIEFVILRTDSSPPVALHLASRRRSYLRLRSLWHTPTRTFTVLMWRPHGRTHTGAGRYPSPSRPWMPACAGMTSLRNEPSGRGASGIFMFCRRAQAHETLRGEMEFSPKGRCYLVRVSLLTRASNRADSKSSGA